MHSQQGLSGRQSGHVPASNAAELGVVLRHLGGVQANVSELMRQQQRHIEQLTAQLIDLRAQRVLERTHRLWGLPEPQRDPRKSHAQRGQESDFQSQISLPAKAWQAAQKVICQTACAGHAHPWLQADGHCARTGKECDAQTNQETR